MRSWSCLPTSIHPALHPESKYEMGRTVVLKGTSLRSACHAATTKTFQFSVGRGGGGGGSVLCSVLICSGKAQSTAHKNGILSNPQMPFTRPTGGSRRPISSNATSSGSSYRKKSLCLHARGAQPSPAPPLLPPALPPPALPFLPAISLSKPEERVGAATSVTGSAFARRCP